MLSFRGTARAFLLLSCFGLPAWAVESSLTPSGFTGLGVTPTAEVMPWGQMTIGYQPQLQGNPSRLSGHDFAVGFGLHPNIEAVGQLATSSMHENCFVGCGVRHLVAAGKFNFRLSNESNWKVGAGAVDIFGATNYFRAYYAVLTFDNGPFQASAGAGRRSGSGIAGSRSPIGNFFGSAAWQPLPLARVHVEFSDRNAWGGVRLFAPSGILPAGWSLSAGANARLAQNGVPLTQRHWWDVAISIPLGKVPEMRRESRDTAEPTRVESQSASSAIPTPGAVPVVRPAPISTQPAAITSPVPDSELQRLADMLAKRGLEDIHVGRTRDGGVAVRVNNGVFRRNIVDALGAALGVVARALGPYGSLYSLVITQRQAPVVASAGQAECVMRWIAGRETYCMAGQLITPASPDFESLQSSAQWTVVGGNPASRNVRLKIGPVIRTKLGTEFGAVEMDAGANIDLELPLWKGASADWGANVPLAHSRNYEPSGAFGNLRIPSGTERIAFTQTMPIHVPLATGARGAAPVIAQLTVGRIGTFYDGVLASARWEPGDGRDRLSITAGVFRNNRYEGGFGPLGTLKRAAPVYASYRHAVLPGRTDVEAVAGQFMNNDRGFQVGVRQWFNDASVGLYYKRTRDTDSTQSHQFLGLELSLRMGPRSDWRPIPHLQIGGSDRFAHSVETVIREQTNSVRTNRGMQVPTPDVNVMSNLDRTGLSYFEENLARIRDAARE